MFVRWSGRGQLRFCCVRVVAGADAPAATRSDRRRCWRAADFIGNAYAPAGSAGDTSGVTLLVSFLLVAVVHAFR